MRLINVLLSLAALALATASSLHAEENVNAAIYIVTYFDVAPGAAAQSAAIARDYAAASRKEEGNAGFEVFEEIARPDRFAILGAWRDKQAAEAHNAAPSVSAFRDKLHPLMISGFGVRPHSGLSVAPPNAQFPQDAVFVLTHVDVFPANKDRAVELVKAQPDAARKAEGNLRYDVLQWDGHLNHFTLVEVWRDRKAFDANITAAHNKEFREKVTPLEGALYDERLYQAVR